MGIGYPRYDDYHSDSQHEPEAELIGGDTGNHTFVLRRNCLLPRALQKSWLRTNLFRSTCTIDGKMCKLIIDFGCCTNVISADAVKKLSLLSEPHPSPYNSYGLITTQKSQSPSKRWSHFPLVRIVTCILRYRSNGCLSPSFGTSMAI